MLDTEGENPVSPNFLGFYRSPQEKLVKHHVLNTMITLM